MAARVECHMGKAALEIIVPQVTEKLFGLIGVPS